MKSLSPTLSFSIAFLFGTLTWPLAAHAQRAMPKPQVPPAASLAKPLNVAFLVYPEVEALDLSGPLDVFVKANSLAPRSYNIYTVAVGTRTVSTQKGALTLTARYTLSNSPRPDIIIVPGASQSQAEKIGANPRVMSWLKRNAGAGQTVMSVCTGAFILGRAGLLDGKNSTSHWLTLDDFQRDFPKTRAFKGVTFIEDGNIVTTAGVSSGIDGAFFLVEKTSGKEVAERIAKALQYRLRMPAYPASKRARVVLSKPSVAHKAGRKLVSSSDPVCGMKIQANTPYVALRNGQIYGFCSKACQEQFEAQSNSTELLNTETR